MADIVTKKPEIQPLRCLIVDDELIAIKDIVSNIEKISFLIVKNACSSAIEAAEVLKRGNIDLMFLDINMPYLSGIEFLESLDKAPLTILSTAYSEYALDGYRLNVIDYLLKPISFQRFFQAVQKAQEIFQTQILLQNVEESQPNLFIRQGDAFQKINCEDILYVEGMQNYLKLHFKEKTFVIHQTMASLEEMLPKDIFFRIHKSYLVNTTHIDSVCGGRIFIDGEEIPISKNRKEEFLNTVIYEKLVSK